MNLNYLEFNAIGMLPQVRWLEKQLFLFKKDLTDS